MFVDFMKVCVLLDRVGKVVFCVIMVIVLKFRAIEGKMIGRFCVVVCVAFWVQEFATLCAV
jgi:hypothetical protein